MLIIWEQVQNQLFIKGGVRSFSKSLISAEQPIYTAAVCAPKAMCWLAGMGYDSIWAMFDSHSHRARTMFQRTHWTDS